MTPDNYHIKYYQSHRHTIRQQAFINKANSRKDTEQYYLKLARQLEPLVRKEKAELKRIKALENKVPPTLPPKKRKRRKVKKYKIIDNDSCILDFK